MVRLKPGDALPVPHVARSVGPAFDPIAYLAHCRACNVQVSINRFNTEPMLSWDISKAHLSDPDLRDKRAPELDIEADPSGRRKVYETLCAEEWIAGARERGVILAPIRSLKGVRSFAALFDCEAVEHFRLRPPVDKSIIHGVLCRELDVDPDDPDFFEKVDARCAILYPEAGRQ